jgi:hypothetical protein
MLLVANDRHFSLKRHQAEIKIAKATGLRRRELETFRPMDVYPLPDEKLSVYVRQGKGGRPRAAQVSADMQDQLLEIFPYRPSDIATTWASFWTLSIWSTTPCSSIPPRVIMKRKQVIKIHIIISASMQQSSFKVFAGD